MLLAAARKARAAHLFTRANTLYERARDLYLQAGARRKARVCLTGMQDIFMYVGSYSRTRAETLEVLSAMYPSVPEEQRAAWLDLPSTESMRWDGVKHYYYDVPINLAYRDVALFQTLPEHVAGYRKAYDMLQPYEAAAKVAAPWQPYAEPREYDFTQTLAVPRAELPATGDLRAWLPLPIVGGPADGRAHHRAHADHLDGAADEHRAGHRPALPQRAAGAAHGRSERDLQGALRPRRAVLQGPAGQRRRLRQDERAVQAVHGLSRQHGHHAVHPPDRPPRGGHARPTRTSRPGPSTCTCWTR